jgi:hypothetical protein
MTKFIEHRTVRRRISKPIVVLYHANCTDGFVAAWSAFRALGKKAEYIGVEHQHEPPDGLTGKTIYLVDFTYPRDIMERLIRDNEKVTTLDHHISVQSETEMTHDYRFALDKSGAHLSWEYFHPTEPVPYLVSVVEDFDLHKQDKDMWTIFDWIDLFDFDFKVYNKLVRTLESAAGRRRALKQGAIVGAYREKCIQRLVENTAYEVQFGEYQVLAVNNELFHHEVAVELSVGRPFGVVWRVRNDGSVYVSLRSDDNGADVQSIAKLYGGGGHTHAAGFFVSSFADLPFKPI